MYDDAVEPKIEIENRLCQFIVVDPMKQNGLWAGSWLKSPADSNV